MKHFLDFLVQHGILSGGEPYMANGFRIEDLSYVSDVSHFTVESKEIVKGSTTLVIDALGRTYSLISLIDLAWTHLSHFSFQQSLEACLELIRPGGFGYFTGLSHSVDHDDVNKFIQNNNSPHLAANIKIECAFDGLEVKI